MTEEIRAEPDALIRLADAALTAADELGNDYRHSVRDLMPPSGAFGNTAASGPLAGVADRLQSDARLAVYVHAQILEADADKLLQAAFAYAAADRMAAEGMGGARGAQL
ncbi:hypothetical protein [Dactylosporangium sp. CA-139066]|uniref:hypothetical protein n=1 Tax=Dactylosporangium sp. CA-139066 TaxID=3239930 RepID=UPI003D8AE4FA